MPKVTASYNRKVQLEQFEPVQYGASVEVEIEDLDEFEEAYEELVEEVEDGVERELARRIAETKLANEEEDDG